MASSLNNEFVALTRPLRASFLVLENISHRYPAIYRRGHQTPTVTTFDDLWECRLAQSWHYFRHDECPLLRRSVKPAAQSGYGVRAAKCPLLGKRRSDELLAIMSVRLGPDRSRRT